MNRKQLLIVLVLAALFGGLGLLVYQRNSASWEGTGAKTAGAKILGNFALNDVGQVVIKNSDSTVTLAKKNDAWVIRERSDYPADFTRIRNLIQGLWDLKSVQNIDVGPSQLGSLFLLPPAARDAPGTGILVELQGSDGKPIGALLLGKMFPKKSDMFPGGEGYPAGRYVTADGGAKVSLVSEAFDQATPTPAAWLDRAFIRPDGIASVTLSGSTPALQWKMSRDTDTCVEWKLDGIKPDEKVDAGKVPPFLGQLSSPSFTDVLPPDAKPAGFDNPQTLTVETFDQITYTLKIGAPQDDGYPVAVTLSANLPRERTPGKDEKPEDKKKLDDAYAAKMKQLAEKVAKEKAFEGRIYLVSKSAIDPLIKTRAELLAEKKAEPSPSPNPPAPGPVSDSGSGAPPPSPAPAHLPVTVTTAPVSLSTPAAKKGN